MSEATAFVHAILSQQVAKSRKLWSGEDFSFVSDNQQSGKDYYYLNKLF